eukprot:scaffold36419_cov62-Phaeocystis_antarctica.AAC.3
MSIPCACHAHAVHMPCDRQLPVPSSAASRASIALWCSSSRPVRPPASPPAAEPASELSGALRVLSGTGRPPPLPLPPPLPPPPLLPPSPPPPSSTHAARAAAAAGRTRSRCQKVWKAELKRRMSSSSREALRVLRRCARQPHQHVLVLVEVVQIVHGEVLLDVARLEQLRAVRRDRALVGRDADRVRRGGPRRDHLLFAVGILGDHVEEDARRAHREAQRRAAQVGHLDGHLPRRERRRQHRADAATTSLRVEHIMEIAATARPTPAAGAYRTRRTTPAAAATAIAAATAAATAATAAAAAAAAAVAAAAVARGQAEDELGLREREA